MEKQAGDMRAVLARASDMSLRHVTPCVERLASVTAGGPAPVGAKPPAGPYAPCSDLAPLVRHAASLGADVPRVYITTARKLMGIDEVRFPKVQDAVESLLSTDPGAAVAVFQALHVLFATRLAKFRERKRAWGPWGVLENIDAAIDDARAAGADPAVVTTLRRYEEVRVRLVGIEAAKSPCAVWIAALESMAAFLNEACSNTERRGELRAQAPVHPSQQTQQRQQQQQQQHPQQRTATAIPSRPVPTREAQEAAQATPDDIE
jgi:phage baseplate assembly protein W